MTVTYVKTTSPNAVIRVRLATPQPTMNEVADKWLVYKSQFVKPSTISTYRAYLKRMLRPTFGVYPACKITNEQITAYIASLENEDSGYAKKTVHMIANLLKQVLAYGRDFGVIADPELCTMHQHSGGQQMANTLTKAEQTKLLAVLGDCRKPSDLGILLSLKTGLRVGEVCGLQWGDIDFSAGFMTVRRTVMRINKESSGTEIYIGQPKSESSMRRIPLGNELLRILKARRQADDVFVARGIAKPQEPTAMQKHFKIVLRHAGVRDINFHALRHTFATQCIDKGFDAKSLSMILGHADVSTTLNIYVHPSMEKLRKMMSQL